MLSKSFQIHFRRRGDQEKTATKKPEMKIEIPAYHDVWMDNGIENLYKLLKNGQDDGFEITIDNNSLIITISNFDKFKESVGITIKNVIRSNLVVMKEDKKTGETKKNKSIHSRAEIFNQHTLLHFPIFFSL